MAATLESIIKQLAESSIIAQGKLENFVPPKAHPKNADELVAQLVQQHHLTAFQAAQVKAGKAKALILGEYTIVDKIGAGGMGQVFKAVHRRMERTVAIKMLPPSLTKDAAALARFQREVIAAARLHHTNIVTAHDAGQAGAAHFLVMEYVDGRDLSATVKKDGPLPVNKAVNYILQAARGLEYAHGEGIIHRDIKPANLLLDKKGVVKILDMGLARIEQADGGAGAELTGTGTIMGTVDYMAPEQALNTKHADQRADIYSLGISLYYLLAGKAVYPGDTAMEKLMAHQHNLIPSLTDVQTTVPKELDAIFKKMVAKRVEQRYQTMSEVVEALEALGYGGTGTLKRGEVASTLNLSSADKKRLASKKKQPLSMITEAVASEKSKNLVFKIVGGAFGTIVAPIMVFYLIRHLEHEEQPPAATVAATADGPSVAGTLRVPPAGTTNDVARSSVAGTLRVPPAGTTDVARSSADGTRSVPATLKAPFDAAAAKAGQAAWAKYLGTQVETTNSVGLRMTLVPPGEFMMGSTPEQVNDARKISEAGKVPETDGRLSRLADEMPQHKVAISRPFLMGTTEVTVVQFRRFAEASGYITEAERYGFGNSPETTLDKAGEPNKGLNWKSPGYATADDVPVTQVSWNDACAYCVWLCEQEHRRPWYRWDGNGSWTVAADANGYRLPTEAEWEYACRAGTTTQFSWGDDRGASDRYAWFDKNAFRRPMPVASKLPNPFGLFDMHGNAGEWCQDTYGGHAWYAASPTKDPLGPPAGSKQPVLRGGSAANDVAYARSAFRSMGFSFSSRQFSYGIRVVRSLDVSEPATAVAATARPSASGTGRAKPWLEPEFQKWVAYTQKLSAEQQIHAVSKKLIELNPGFDGTLSDYELTGRKPRIFGGHVTDVGVPLDRVADISPLRAFGHLEQLRVAGSSSSTRGKLSDLSPLAGMQLKVLVCQFTPVADLSPLAGMKLERIWLDGTQVSDLEPLRGMALTMFNASATRISNLEPLRGMKLSGVNVSTTSVSDLSPLAGMPLVTLQCNSTMVADLTALEKVSTLASLNLVMSKVTGDDVARLQRSLPNCAIQWPVKGQIYRAAGSGRKLAYLDPAFQKWVAETKKLPAEKQVETVTKKLMELNPAFDGKLESPPRIEGGVVKGFSFVADQVSDISPVRALAGLERLSCCGTSGNLGLVAELSPLAGLPLTELLCHHTQVSDLSPLEGMKLTVLNINSTYIEDLSPLRGMPLKELSCSAPVRDLSPLAGMPLETLLINNNTKMTDLTPLAGLKLKELRCSGTHISDISPLSGMPLTYLSCCNDTTDLSPLAGMPLEELLFTPRKIARGIEVVRAIKSLEMIGTDSGGKDRLPAAEFWKRYDAGEFGKPATPKKLAYLDPAFQKWGADTQKLPAEKQIEAVSKKLMELNPGFDGSVTHTIEKGAVRYLIVATDKVTDISPVRALAGLTSLKCTGSNTHSGSLSDLSPLQPLKLGVLVCSNTKVFDLSPLEGMPLTSLSCSNTQVSDLSPLRGMRLTTLLSSGTSLSDLSPLQDCKYLKTLSVANTKVTPAQVAALQKALPNCKIEWDDPTNVAKPKLAYLDPAFQKWVADTQKLPADRQIEAVSKKLMELNPGFDGKLGDSLGHGTPLVSKGDVIDAAIDTDQASDVSPIRAFARLRVLRCEGSAKGKGRLVDLSLLGGLGITDLGLGRNPIRDLSPLAGMPLTMLAIPSTEVSDLSPLAGMKLTYLVIQSSPVADLAPLAGMPLRKILCSYCNISDVSPLAGMPLAILDCTHNERLADISALSGMPLEELICGSTAVADLSPLRSCSQLTHLKISNTKATAARVAALQKALPRCQIEWNAVGTSATPSPVSAGTK